MQVVSDSVAPEFPIYKVVELIRVIFDFLPYSVESLAWLANIYCFEHRLSRDSAEFLDVFVDISDHDHCGVVAVVAIEVADDIDVQIVAVLKHIVVGDSMRDNIIHRGAHALGEVVEVDRRGVPTVVHDELVHALVDLIQSNALFGEVHACLQGSRGEVGSGSQALLLFLVENKNGVLHDIRKRLFLLAHVWRPDDVIGNLAGRTNSIFIYPQRLCVLAAIMEFSGWQGEQGAESARLHLRLL